MPVNRLATAILIVMVALILAVPCRAGTDARAAGHSFFDSPAPGSEEMAWIEIAAHQGNPAAQETLALLHYFGAGKERSRREAMAWIRRAAESGAPLAMALSAAVDAANGDAASPRVYILWLQLAREKGSPLAYELLGIEYFDGRTLPRDMEKARQCFRFAAEHGLPQSQYYLGFFHLHGIGMPPSAEEAVSWFRKAAEAGIPAAQYELGRMLAAGEGVQRDNREAEKWLRQAAPLERRAGRVLWLLYQQGQLTPAGNLEKMHWMNAAASSDDREAQKELLQLIEDGRLLPEHLTDYCRNRLALYWRYQAALR